MLEQVVKVINRAGVHARPSSVIASATQRFKASIHFTQGSNTINAKSILGIITLGATYNSEIKITCEGEDEKEALETLVHIFETKFEEE
jgi:phosphocarrier protein